MHFFIQIPHVPGRAAPLPAIGRINPWPYRLSRPKERQPDSVTSVAPAPAPAPRSPRAATFLKALRLRGFSTSVFGDGDDAVAAAPGMYLRPWPFSRCVGVAAPLFPPRGVADGNASSSRLLRVLPAFVFGGVETPRGFSDGDAPSSLQLYVSKCSAHVR